VRESRKRQEISLSEKYLEKIRDFGLRNWNFPGKKINATDYQKKAIRIVFDVEILSYALFLCSMGKLI